MIKNTRLLNFKKFDSKEKKSCTIVLSQYKSILKNCFCTKHWYKFYKLSSTTFWIIYYIPKKVCISIWKRWYPSSSFRKNVKNTLMHLFGNCDYLVVSGSNKENISNIYQLGTTGSANWYIKLHGYNRWKITIKKCHFVIKEFMYHSRATEVMII